jgi:two-component system, cell cycle sensor histidine kinase and response regulator CckA
MEQTQLIGGIALAMQLGTAVYALRLNRLFGTDRAGWSLFGAFALMLAVHLSDVYFSQGDATAQLVYLISSVLLLIGLAHVGMLFKERLRTEEVIRASRDQLDARVRERTFELAQANDQLQAEIVERKRAEVEIKASQARYQELVNSLDCVVFEAEGPGLQFTFLSPQCEMLLGYPPDTLIGRQAWRDFVHPDDVQTVVGSCSSASASIEFRALAKNGRELWLRQLSTITSENGAVAKIRGVLLDITEWRRMEAHLRDAQKLESIRRLAGGVAHDFNNLLTVIQGHAAYLLSLDDLPDAIRDSLRAIHSGSERAAQVTSQLLDFGQGREVELRVLDLNRIINNHLQTLRSIVGDGIDLHFELSETPLAVQADADLLEQVLVNLALNARETMPHGGELKIRTATAVIAQDHTSDGMQLLAGSYVCLAVSDTGRGIAPDDLPRIFEPFFTTKQTGKGPGLGLASVYGIVRQHGGWITVASIPGQGTTFEVHLPLTLESLPAQAYSSASPVTGNAPGGSETILVVEDQAPVRRLVSDILRRLGYHVLEAESGVAALQVWPVHRDRVDLLLTDIIMPGGVNGWQLAEKLTADKPGLRVLCTSGYSPEKLRSNARHRLLPKPYDLPELAQAIREVLDFERPENPAEAPPVDEPELCGGPYPEVSLKSPSRTAITCSGR